jgi:hypothetical protein
MLLAPDGRVLDTFRASGDAARDAIMQHTEVLTRARAEGQPPAAVAPAVPSEVLPPAPDRQGEEEVPLDSSNGSNGSSSSSTSNGSEAKEACGVTPEPACASPPQSAAGEAPAAAVQHSSSTAEDAAAAALQQAKQQFLAQYGGSYGYGGWLDVHYEAEVGARLGQGHHYLDYTGEDAAAAI